MIGLDTYADDSNIGNGGSGRDSNPRTFENDPVFPNASLYHHSVMMNVDRSLGQWIRRQQKIGKSSPDLSLIGRRLSLPDSVLAASAAFYPFTSLLESQVWHGPNGKNPPKIRFKNSGNWLVTLMPTTVWQTFNMNPKQWPETEIIRIYWNLPKWFVKSQQVNFFVASFRHLESQVWRAMRFHLITGVPSLTGHAVRKLLTTTTYSGNKQTHLLHDDFSFDCDSFFLSHPPKYP